VPRWLRGWRAAAAGALVVVGALAAAALARTRPSASGAAPVTLPAASPASVMVLPLVNIGSDSTNNYLAAGITNELAAALGRVKGVRVVSPSRAAAMLAMGKTSAEIGKELDVALQLEGTVQREGKRLRVTARLVNVNDGVMRWSDMYERDATDLLAVQGELTRAITLAVGSEMNGTNALALAADTAAAFAPDSADMTTAKAAAYDAYLRGRFQLARRGARPLRQAIAYFREAIGKDPALALAYSGLADAQGLLPLYANEAPAPALRAALESADRAIALDSSLAEVWASRGLLHGRSWQWAEAERDFRRAIALKESYAPALQSLGELMLVRGRTREGVAWLARAASLEPSSPLIVGSLAMGLALAGRGAEAAAAGERAVSYDSTLLVPRVMLGMTRLYMRQPTLAIQALTEAVRIDPDSRTALGALGYAYGAAGDVVSAQRTAARLSAMPGGPGKEVALARVALGMRDTAQALDRLERAARARDPLFATESIFSPVFDGVRASPRFGAMLRTVGL
jgi:serine/threonine-protein kinase